MFLVYIKLLGLWPLLMLVVHCILMLIFSISIYLEHMRQ